MAGPAAAQDRDLQEVQKYALSEAGLAKYTQASKNLAALGTEVPADCSDDSDSNLSLDQTVAKLEATPGFKSAVQSSGMTTREYFVFSLSLLQNGLAAWGMTQPGGKLPSGMSQANVDFINKHKAEIEATGRLDEESAGCDDDRNDES